ncbi:hypothetical protein KPL70_025867 [Citrus sinensis]|nr:hypothetical protein KPL70_025867 [Citrus sinensis]
MTTSKFQVEKFTRENDFHLWRLKMRALLVHQGLEETLGDPRSEKKPSKLSDEEMQDALDKAHSTLILSLGDGVLREVGDQTTVVGLWKKLEDLYTKKSLTKRLCTKKMLYTLQIEEGSFLENHIDNFNRIILDLEDINVKLEDEDKAIILSSSLPPSYEHFVDTLLYRRQSITMVDCHKEGHFMKDYPERKNKGKNGPKKNGDVVVALEKKDDDGYDSSSVLLAIGTQTNVMMGNNSLCKVVGLGAIRLKMFDGVIRELSEVMHVPELKRNLISLGILDQMGCIIKMEFGVMKIIKWSIVIMKGAKNNGLYVLQGTTITRDVSVLTSQNLNKTLMWHMRLGHMSEKGIKILERQGVLGDDKLGPVEFCEFDDFCAQNEVVRHKTIRHTPQQNELVERINRTLMKKKVRSPSSAIDFKIPVEMWSGRAANYSDLKIFGYPAFAHVKQGKLEPRALKCVFLGYPEDVKAYKLWCIDLKPPRCIVSRDVVFNEQEMLKSYTQKPKDSNKDTNLLKDQIKVELTRKSGDTTSYETSEDEGRDVDNSDETSESQTTLQDYQLARDKEMRVIRAPKKYGYVDLIAYALTAAHELDYDEPKSYKEAVSGKNEDQCLKTMKEEIDSLYKNDTWGISEVEPVRFKARLVAKGFTQKEGIDFTEKLKGEFDMKDLGPKKKILRMQLHRNRNIGTLFLSQEEYIRRVLDKFGMANSKPVQTPLAPHFRLLSDQLCPKVEAEMYDKMNVPYASVVGCLMYAMVLTKHDLSYSVSVVSRCMANAGKEHWRAVK